MKSLHLFFPTAQKIFHQPAIILLLIIEISILVLFLFGLQLTYEDKILVSISFLGKTFENDYTTRSILQVFIKFFWSVLIFLYILCTSSLFAEFFSDPLLSIYLTKGFSRPNLLLSHYIYCIIVILLIQSIFSVLLVLIYYIKSGIFILQNANALIFGPATIIAVLIALGAFISIVFEKPIVPV